MPKTNVLSVAVSGGVVARGGKFVVEIGVVNEPVASDHLPVWTLVNVRRNN